MLKGQLQPPNPRKKSWLRLLVALYYDQKVYAKAAATLEQLVLIRPGKTKYWKQLSSVYLAMDEEDRALAVLEMGLLQEQKSYRRKRSSTTSSSIFVSRCSYKAGRYLEKAISAEKVTKTSKNFELLAESWIQAQELDLALNALNKAAPLSKDGRIYVRQGQLYLEKEEWVRSIESLEKGLAKGGLKQIGLAHLALGIAHFNSGSTQLAIESFRKAVKYPKFEKQAKEWLNHIKS